MVKPRDSTGGEVDAMVAPRDSTGGRRSPLSGDTLLTRGNSGSTNVMTLHDSSGGRRLSRDGDGRLRVILTFGKTDNCGKDGHISAFQYFTLGGAAIQKKRRLYYDTTTRQGAEGLSDTSTATTIATLGTRVISRFRYFLGLMRDTAV